MRGIALCCGFNNYEFSPLERALNDAAILYTRLIESGRFHGTPDLIGHGEVFTQRTSADAILDALARAAASAADLVWFSFSGHAITSPGGELRLLLPAWRRDASEHDRRAYSIGAGQIAKILRARCTSKKFVVVLDTCYSGAFGQHATVRDIRPALGEQLASSGVVVISSCSDVQVASDGARGSRELTGTFTGTVIRVLEDHVREGTALSVLQLFLEVKARIRNGQQPTLYANGLTDDFLILHRTSGLDVSDGIVPLLTEVPAVLKPKLSTFLHSLVRIRRQQRVGMIHAERQLERLAAEFSRYADDTFVVSCHSSSIVEAIENAQHCIVGCTTPPYIERWPVGGLGLMGAIREFIANHGGRVIRFFFMPADFKNRVPGVLPVVREHLEAGILTVIVDVDSFGPAVLQEVFKDPQPRDLSSLECTFVDGKTFLKTHFAANGELKVEVDQRPDRSQHEYQTQLRPFLSSSTGVVFMASLDEARDVVLYPLQLADLSELKHQLEADLCVAA